MNRYIPPVTFPASRGGLQRTYHSAIILSMNSESSLSRLAPRDRTIIRREVADKIEQLLPITKLGGPWRAAFEQQIDKLTAKANGMSRFWESRSEVEGWALAHQFVLDEVQGGE